MEKLKEVREALGWTQAQLAEKVGVSAANISRYEAGKRGPPVDVLIKIVEVLDVSADYLLGIKNAPVPEVDRGSREEMEKEAVERVKKLNPSQKKEFRSILEYILANIGE